MGLGRVRHLATADLWVQQRLRMGSFSVAKYPTDINGADLMTKHKSRHDIMKLLGLIGFSILPGRPESAPLRSTKWNIGIPISSPTSAPTITTTTTTDHKSGNDVMAVDDAADRSLTIHHYPMQTSFLEGKRLMPSRKVPPVNDRMLWSVMDMHTGEALYDARMGSDQEPDLFSLVDALMLIF